VFLSCCVAMFSEPCEAEFSFLAVGVRFRR
jgi:hypothetical protein